jgi:hypothetical protein
MKNKSDSVCNGEKKLRKEIYKNLDNDNNNKI